MAKTAAGRKLGRKTGFRNQLLRGLASELFKHEQIRTTYPKARECSRLAEKLITTAKKGDLNARRAVARDLRDTDVMKKLFDVIAPRYAARNGGYTRVLKLASRQGDNAQLALIKLIA